MDSSGLEFFYTNTRATHEAGLLTVGHAVRPSMVIPPNADSYEVVGFCSGQCTEEVSIMCFPFVQKCLLITYHFHLVTSFSHLMVSQCLETYCIHTFMVIYYNFTMD